jgi:hypothetical protein
MGIAFGAFAIDSVTKLADTGEQLEKMSKATGMSIKSLSVLKQAATEMNTPIETVTMGIKKMQMSMGNLDGEGEKTKLAMDALGLSFNKIKELSPEEQFMQIGNKIAQVADPATKTALAIQFFGRTGTELISFFNDGKTSMAEMTKRAEQMGVAFDENMVTKALAADAAFDKLNGMWNGFITTIAVTLAPMVTQVAEGLSLVIKYVSNWEFALKQISDYLLTFGIDTTKIWEQVKLTFEAAWVWIETQILPRVQKLIDGIQARMKLQFSS